ncbi:MAG: hypothetical protein ACRCS9_09670 [Hyphomicrobium sp.]
MVLKRIRLNLARDHDFPNGSSEHGYEFIAPIDDAGHLQAGEWREARARCRVRRFWAGKKDEIGLLKHRPGGSWAFDYDPNSKDDDEAGFKLDKHKFTPGEYVSFKDHDGHLRTYIVASVGEFE